MKTLPQPWTAAMEATIFTGWIYDYLLPHAAALKVAHPLMLRAIAAAKRFLQPESVPGEAFPPSVVGGQDSSKASDSGGAGPGSAFAPDGLLCPVGSVFTGNDEMLFFGFVSG